jgi:hypothetical protein
MPLTLTLTILAQAHLQERQTGDRHQPKRDQHQCEGRSQAAAEQAAHNTGDGQAGRRAESGDPSAPTHRGRERIGLGVGVTVSKRPQVALQVAGAEFATRNPRRVWPG